MSDPGSSGSHKRDIDAEILSVARREAVLECVRKATVSVSAHHDSGIVDIPESAPRGSGIVNRGGTRAVHQRKSVVHVVGVGIEAGNLAAIVEAESNGVTATGKTETRVRASDKE